ncbi:mitochondrial carrier domain-containing protein [Aspergillus unguis]
MTKEFIVGASGGVTQVLIGQPFDIIKVRMQTQASRNALQVARQIYVHEGVLAFYRVPPPPYTGTSTSNIDQQGTLPPLLGVGACISIVYSTFHAVAESLKPKSHPSQSLTPAQTYLAGGIAGLANSVISGPTEHVRIRLQTQTQSHPNPPLQSPANIKVQPGHGVLATLRQIHAQAGVAGLYRGQVPTLLREFGSYGVWFSVYEYLLRYTSRGPGKGEDQAQGQVQPQTWKIAACGAITGMVLWVVNYPMDVVKSKMQADGFGPEQKYTGMRDVIVQTWRAEGVRGFWRGVGIAVGRAAPVAGGTFVVVEMVRDIL